MPVYAMPEYTGIFILSRDNIKIYFKKIFRNYLSQKILSHKLSGVNSLDIYIYNIFI